MLSTKPWRFDAVVLFIAGVFACLCLGMIAGGFLRKAGAPGFHAADDYGMVLIGTLCVQGVAWPLSVAFLRQHQMNVAEAFGFRGPDAPHAVSLGVIVALGMCPVSWGLQGLSSVALDRLHWHSQEQVALTLLQEASLPWVQVYLDVFAILVAPVAEEFVFRGMLYPLFKQTGFPKTAVVSVSLLFALIHGSVALIPPLFALALAFTWLYEKTDNLLAPITAHICFNSANLIVLFLFQPQILHFSR